jgi:hypothetical protein
VQRSPPGKRTRQPSGLRKPYGKSDLTRRRTRQELAERDEIGVGTFRYPLTPGDEFIVEIAEMSNRSAEGREAQPQVDEQDRGDRDPLGGQVIRRIPRHVGHETDLWLYSSEYTFGFSDPMS